MKIIIDLKEKTIEVPKDLKATYDSQVRFNKKMGIEDTSILSTLSNIGLKDYKVITKRVSTIEGDKTKQKDIDNYMESNVRNEDSQTYEEYIKLRDSYVVNSRGIKTKTNFLTIKKWFYEKYPDLKPLVK